MRDTYTMINHTRRQREISNTIIFLTFISDFTQCDISEYLIIKQRYQDNRSYDGIPKEYRKIFILF